jgi:hypothetical protein
MEERRRKEKEKEKRDLEEPSVRDKSWKLIMAGLVETRLVIRQRSFSCLVGLSGI